MEECVLEMKFDIKKAPLGECVCVHFRTKPMEWILYILSDDEWIQANNTNIYMTKLQMKTIRLFNFLLKEN